MREPNFENVQSALRTAVKEPEHAPQTLIERTARRCAAVLAGREAESRLKNGKSLPAEEVYSLAAAGLLGQLALGRALPEGKALPDMSRELSESSWFRSYFTGASEDALRVLHSGKLMDAEVRQTRSSVAAKGAALQL